MQDSARLLHKPNESCVQAREEAAHRCHQGVHAEVWPEYGLFKLIEQDRSDISLRLRHCEIDAATQRDKCNGCNGTRPIPCHHKALTWNDKMAAPPFC